LNEIHGATPRLAVDGDFGQKSGNALDAALARLELAGDAGDVGVLRRFLRRSAQPA
jgi:hypothetical protein